MIRGYIFYALDGKRTDNNNDTDCVNALSELTSWYD